MLLDINEDIKNIKSNIRHGYVQEMHEILYFIAKKLQPKNYLEIGVWHGRSMALVLKASSQTNGYGVDTWAPHASFINSTPEEVIKRFQQVDIFNLPTFLTGKSYVKLPMCWNADEIPQLFQLILVDGDHNYEVAKKDLNLCFAHLDKGGILIFHDIVQHVWLADLFSTFKEKLTNFVFFESYFGCGTCIAFKLPLCEEILFR